MNTQLAHGKFREPVQLAFGAKLRAWRKDRHMNQRQACVFFEVSFATLSRYERGYPPPLDIANKIVAITRGKIRYRDLYWNFHPEYA